MVQSQAFTALQSTQGRISAQANGGLVAGRTGAVSDAVLLFTVAPTVVGQTPDRIEAANDANLGTSVIVREAGWYALELYVEILADALIPIVGISKNVAAAGLTGAPSFAIAGFLDVQQPVIAVASAAGVIAPLKITTIEEVTQLEASNVVGGVEGAIFRFHSAIAAGATPGAGLVQATPYYRVKRIANSYS